MSVNLDAVEGGTAEVRIGREEGEDTGTDIREEARERVGERAGWRPQGEEIEEGKGGGGCRLEGAQLKAAG